MLLQPFQHRPTQHIGTRNIATLGQSIYTIKQCSIRLETQCEWLAFAFRVSHVPCITRALVNVKQELQDY